MIIWERDLVSEIIIEKLVAWRYLRVRAIGLRYSVSPMHKYSTSRGWKKLSPSEHTLYGARVLILWGASDIPVVGHTLDHTRSCHHTATMVQMIARFSTYWGLRCGDAVASFPLSDLQLCVDLVAGTNPSIGQLST
jgi:hypothetical protein